MDKTTHQALIMIRGLPGSGKSYLAVALQAALGEENVIILDPDKIDYNSAAYHALCQELATEGVEEKFYPNRFLKWEGYQAISAGKSVIWNQAFTDLGGFGRSAESLQTYATENIIELPLLVVEVEISHDAAKARVARRESQGGHGVNEEAFARFINDYKSFADQGYTTVSVNGEDDISVSVSTVVQALGTLRAAGS